MFELQHPGWLLLWVVLPLMAWRAFGGGGQVGLRYSSLRLLRGGASLRVALAWIPDVIGILGVALLIFALARPQLTHREQVVESEGIDIMLAVDVSGSMDALDFEVRGQRTSRLEVAKEVVDDFVEGREYDRVGVVVFGEEAFTQVPLTLDHDSLRRFLSQIEIGMAGGNATAIGTAIAVSSARLAELEAPSKVVILLTDGRSNAGRLNPDQAAEVARALGIKVYTVGVGSTGGRSSGGIFGFFRASRGDEIDERTLTRVAQATGAEYFRATDTDSLREIYARIDALETTTAEVTEYVHREELFRWALVPGFALMVLQQLLMATALRRLP